MAFAGLEHEILRSEDGGASWTEVHSGPSLLWAVVCWNDRNVYAAKGNRLLESRDGGRTWSTVRKFERSVFGLRRAGADLWLVGEAGLCFRFDPQSGVFSDHSTPLRDAALFDIGTIVAVGGGGTILVSPEDRPEWRRMAVETDADLVSLDFSPATGDAYVVGGIQEGVVVGTPSRIALFSHDLQEWRELRLPHGPQDD